MALAACSGDDKPPTAAGTTSAQPQKEARLAAVRLVGGNPPRIAVVTMAADGSHQRVVVKAPRDESPSLLRTADPVWSPDGAWIYFTGVLEERDTREFTYYTTDVFAVRPDGSELERLTTSEDASRPLPTPDGETLVITRTAHADRFPPSVGMWLMNSDGSQQRSLAAAQDEQLDLPGSVSPDGRRLAFTRCRFRPPLPNGMQENTCAIYTLDLDGSNLLKLAPRSSEPAYSPDGRHIAFVSDRDEAGIHRTGSDEQAFAAELYVMDSEGDDPRRLTETKMLAEEHPAWSPDGSRIAYAREGPRSFVRQLMVITGDGSCPTRIAGDAANSDLDTPWFQQPAWRPGHITGELPPLVCE